MTERYRHPLNDRMSALRTLLAFLALAAALFGHWWLLLTAAALSCVLLGGYEVLGAGFLFDVLFPTGGALAQYTSYGATVLLLVIAAVCWLVRMYLPRFSLST